MGKNIFKTLVIVSIVCYVVAHIVPVYGVEGRDAGWYQGIWMNLFGCFSYNYLSDNHIEFFIWCANPIYFITLFCLWAKRAYSTKYCPSWFEIGLSTLGALLGMQYTWSRGIVLDEGGSFHHVDSLYIGYWLWVMALVSMAVALWMKRYREED